MSDTRDFEGADLDDALRAASDALKRPVDDLAWELVEEGRRGVFGLGARQVRVRVALSGVAAALARAPAAPAAAANGETPVESPPPEAAAPAPPDGLERTANQMLLLMGFRVTARLEPHAAGWTLRIEGPDHRQLARGDGEVLEALEFLLHRMGRRAWPGVGSLRIECEGFRNRRDGQLVVLARKAAANVARTGRSEILEAMNPYERRLVHLAVRETSGVVSRSEGEGFLKRVRVERETD